MSTIEIACSLIPGSTDTPLDARTRIGGISDVETIANPYVTMTFSVLDTGKTYKVKTLKSKRIGPIEVPNALIDEYELVPDAEALAELREEIGDAQPSEVTLPASILTIPIPSDADNHTLSLMVDVCEDGEFPEDEVTHILMAAHRAKMKIFSEGQFVDIPDDGIGTPFYGETVVFQLDNEMMESYEPGRTYFGRYRWLDSAGGRTDWCGFRFTYDMNDLRPVKLPDTSGSRVAEVRTLTGSPVIDYLDGDIQNFTMTANVVINRANIRNVPYGKALMLIIQKQGDCTLTVTNGSTSEILTINKTYLIGAVDVGQILLTVSETVG